MTRKHRLLFLIVTALLLVCIGCTLIELLLHPLRRTYDSVILDSVNHYLPCSALPAEEKVLQVVDQYRDDITRIEEADPGSIGVEVDTGTCPGKGDLVIWYSSHANRLLVERMLDGKTFHGIPYRLQNR